MKTVLCFSGGGVRGIISLVLMKQLEDRYVIKPDLLVGVSTGAIIASAYSIGMTTDEILKAYLEEIGKIFKKDFWRNIRTMDGWLGAIYDDTILEKSLQRIFKDRLLPNFTATPLMINAYSLKQKPIFFKDYKTDNLCLLRQAIKASCSAPTFFMPEKIKEIQNVDGGVDSNNPCMNAYTEAKKYFGEDEPIRVMLIGTGKFEKEIIIKNGGKLEWAKYLVDLFMGANSFTPSYLLRKDLKDGDIFDEIDVKLKKDIALDDISKETIDFMLKVKREGT
jgi:patatin-like phospholipase/acyl hydrolase